jgi:hypothetical protein
LMKVVSAQLVDAPVSPKRFGPESRRICQLLSTATAQNRSETATVTPFPRFFSEDSDGNSDFQTIFIQ